MANEHLKEVLAKYLPPAAVQLCAVWIVEFNIHLRITRSRASKYGDYRPHPDNNGHIITLNHDLNPYAFLITFTHEVAHLICEKKYWRRAAPHGREWKREYAVLINYLLLQNMFPEDIHHALARYMKDPAASTCNDATLFRTLRKYDRGPLPHIGEGSTVHNGGEGLQDAEPANGGHGGFYLEDISHGALFKLRDSARKLVFRKGEKMRKRFRCMEVNSKTEYFINPLAEVVLSEE